MDALQTARFLITGKVQGVWFRASTRNEALRLNLRGYASNRADGKVEVLAMGEADAIALLFNWLRHGPPLAEVESVECVNVGSCLSGPMDADGFQIR